MATFKVLVLRENQKQNGSMPVVIRITHSRATKYIPTPYFAFPQQLDRNGEPKEPNLKARVNDTYNSVKDILDELGFRVNSYAPDELKEYVKKQLYDGGGSDGIDFFTFAQRYIDKIKDKQLGTAENHTNALNNLERYIGQRKLTITDLTANFLYKYLEWMRKEGGKLKKGAKQPLGERGQSLYLGSIRTIFNEALREYNDYDKGNILIPNRPFERFKIQKARPIKTAEDKALTVEQIKSIRDYAPRFKRDALARDCFMLSFYLCGMNSVDLFRCDKLKEGVITYYRSKVTGKRDDKAEMRVRVELEALPLLEKYRGKKTVFSFYERYNSKDTFNAQINAGLKIIGKAIGVKDLAFYFARHSWATLAANDCGIPVDIVDECLAHVDSRIAKKYYIKKDWTRIYKANRKVLDLLN